MPLFEYRCEECEHLTEFLENAGTDAEHECEKCKSHRVSKVLSVFSVKGDGTLRPQGPACPTGKCPLG